MCRSFYWLGFLLILFSASTLMAQNLMNPTPARPLANSGAASVGENADSGAAETANVTDPIQGDLKKDQPNFPSFLVKAVLGGEKPQQKVLFYFINKNGNTITQVNQGQPDVNPVENLFSKHCNVTGNEICTSFDGKWSYLSGDVQDYSFVLRNNSTQKQMGVSFADEEPWNPLCWNPAKDVFYFLAVGGAAPEHIYTLFQFDPSDKTFVQIPGNGGINLSPDGNWIVWWLAGFHIYSVEKNVDYKLPGATLYGEFYQWGKAGPEDIKAKVDDLIQNGKRFYLKHRYAEAVAEYQKAIELDPENSLAYGYLGYSTFRLGNNQAAILDLTKSIELDKWNTKSYYNLALSYWADNQKEKAIECLAHIPYEEGATAAGYLDKKPIQGDPQFKEMLNSPEFIKAFGR